MGEDLSFHLEKVFVSVRAWFVPAAHPPSAQIPEILAVPVA
jgi:hypothetical protein